MGEVSFFRYTDLPSLIHILTERQLTLLDPMSWDDKNDSNFITLYREKCELQSVLALCFSKASETYHHWRVFAPGPSGVRISFNEAQLRASMLQVPGLQLRPVEYVKIQDARGSEVSRFSLPFLKRYPFHPEEEVRLLWESSSEKRLSLPAPIELSSVNLVTLSPWLHPSLVDSVKTLLKGIAGCEHLTIHRSTLVSNAEWLKHGVSAT